MKNNLLPNKDKLSEEFNKYQPVLSDVLFNIESLLKKSLKLTSMPTFKSRVKDFGSYYKKLLRVKPVSLGEQNLPILTDIIGIRVICAFLEDLSVVEKQIIDTFDIKEIERKGADRTFSEFGYESVHILIDIPKELRETFKTKNITLPDDLVCEIQVRTILQDAWAEVEHELVYKSEFSPFDLPLRRKLASMNASLSLADIIFQEIRDYQNKLNKELDCRRNTFYEQADILSHEKLIGEKDIDNKNVITEINPSLQYVHSTIDDMILDAIHAHNTGDLDKAEIIYTKIIQAKPEPNKIVLSVIYKHRGMAYFAQNKYTEALEDFTNSVDNDPNNFRSLYYIGIVYSVMEENEQAISFFDRSIMINEYQSHVYYRRALSNYHLCKFDDAMTDLKKAMQLGLEDDDVKKLYETLSIKLEMKF